MADHDIATYDIALVSGKGAGKSEFVASLVFATAQNEIHDQLKQYAFVPSTINDYGILENLWRTRQHSASISRFTIDIVSLRSRAIRCRLNLHDPPGGIFFAPSDEARFRPRDELAGLARDAEQYYEACAKSDAILVFVDGAFVEDTREAYGLRPADLATFLEDLGSVAQRLESDRTPVKWSVRGGKLDGAIVCCLTKSASLERGHEAPSASAIKQRVNEISDVIEARVHISSDEPILFNVSAYGRPADQPNRHPATTMPGLESDERSLSGAPYRPLRVWAPILSVLEKLGLSL